MPRLDVAPTGRLDVVYFDRRADRTNVYNEVSLQSSFDNGRTFTRRVRVSDRAFDSRIGPGRERELADLGSRLALVSTNRRALAIWPDTRGGSEVTSKQEDLASAVIDIPPPAATSRTWLRAVGAVAVMLSVASLVLALRTRRAPVGNKVLVEPTVDPTAPAGRPRRSRRVPPPVPPSPPPSPATPSTPPAAAPVPPGFMPPPPPIEAPVTAPGAPPAVDAPVPAGLPAGEAIPPPPPAQEAPGEDIR